MVKTCIHELRPWSHPWFNHQDFSAGTKALYFLLSLIGITGMIFLFGIMVSFLLHEKN